MAEERESKAAKAGDEASAMSAEDLAKEFREHSVAEFFKKNRQMLGLSGKIKTLTTIVHEYVTNSIDACEEAKILPEIEVKISELGEEHYEVFVKDNGPGLTKETVGKALGQLLAGTKFHRMIQQRGQQGIGASGCTLLAQMSTGKPIHVITGTGKGNPISLELTIDPKKNEPKIMKLEELHKAFRGLAIKAQFKDVKYQKSDQSALEYLRRTAIANPHAEISFMEPDGTKTLFKRSVKEIPERPIEIQPHPKGVTVDEVVSMAKYAQSRKVSGFLKSEFDRMGDTAVAKIAEIVSSSLKDKLSSIDLKEKDLKKTFLNLDPKKLSWEECEQIVKAFKKTDFLAPRLDALRPIGEAQIEKSLKNIVEPEFLSVVTRKPTVYQGGFPFQVEVGVGFGGNAGRMSGKDEEGKEVRKMETMRFANRTPLLFDAGGCALTKAVQSIEWKRYGIKDIESAPMTVFVNMISVHIPYTGAGKQAVSDEEEVVEEIRLALMEAGRKIYRFIGGKRREAEKQEKRRLFYKYATEVAIAVSELTGEKKDLIEKKLHDIVLKRLKLDEKMEAEEFSEETEEESKAKKGKKAAEAAGNGNGEEYE